MFQKRKKDEKMCQKEKASLVKGRIFRRVKKSHSWPIEYVGATIGRPPTWRSNAFSG